MKMKDVDSYIIKIYRRKKIKPIVFETEKQDTFDKILIDLNTCGWIMVGSIILYNKDIKYIVKEDL